ncbi:hypothetical protein BB561_006319, partial [Smittium simulii]
MGRLDKLKSIKKITKIFQKKDNDEKKVDDNQYLAAEPKNSDKIKVYASEPETVNSHRAQKNTKNSETKKDKTSKLFQMFTDAPKKIRKSVSAQPTQSSMQYKQTENYMSNFEQVIESERKIDLLDTDTMLGEGQNNVSHTDLNKSRDLSPNNPILSASSKRKSGELNANFILENEKNSYKQRDLSDNKNYQIDNTQKDSGLQARMNKSNLEAIAGEGVAVGIVIPSNKVKFAQAETATSDNNKVIAKNVNNSLASIEKNNTLASKQNQKEDADFVAVDLGSPNTRYSNRFFSGLNITKSDKKQYRQSTNVMFNKNEKKNVKAKSRYSSYTLDVSLNLESDDSLNQRLQLDDYTDKNKNHRNNSELNSNKDDLTEQKNKKLLGRDFAS